jgi:hypothetical protein
VGAYRRLGGPAVAVDRAAVAGMRPGPLSGPGAELARVRPLATLGDALSLLACSTAAASCSWWAAGSSEPKFTLPLASTAVPGQIQFGHPMLTLEWLYSERDRPVAQTPNSNMG